MSLAIFRSRAMAAMWFFALVVSCVFLCTSCTPSPTGEVDSGTAAISITPSAIIVESGDIDVAGPTMTVTKTGEGSAATDPQTNAMESTPTAVIEIDRQAGEPAGCSEKNGSMEVIEIESQYSSNGLKFRVYTPPCYDEQKVDGYPVLYLLHGQGFDDDQWDRLEADEIAAGMVSSGCAVPFLMVMPWEEFDLVDPWESGFDRAILEDLIPWIDRNYPTCDERECRAIGGISRGAAWAIRIGLMHWEYFGSLGAHSFPPFRNDFYLLPDWLRVFPSDQRPRIYVDIGTYDRNLDAANEFQMAFVTYRLPYEWHSFEGMHDEEYWSTHVADYLQWYVIPWNEKFGMKKGRHS